MSDCYQIHGRKLFSILSISDFDDTGKWRSNASADAKLMRRALEHLGMTEFEPEMGNQRFISTSAAFSHVNNLADNISDPDNIADLVVIVIASHGVVRDNIQRWDIKTFSP